MVALIEQGNDIVCGWRKDRKDTFVTRRVPEHDGEQADLVGDRRAAARLRLFAEGVSRRGRSSRCASTARCIASCRRSPARSASRSPRWWSTIGRAAPASTKYGLSRTIRVVLDLATVKFLLSYSTRPLQIFGLLGIIAGGLGALITGYLGYIRLFTAPGHRRSSAAAARRDAGVHRRPAA